MALICDECLQQVEDRSSITQERNRVTGGLRELCPACAERPCTFCGAACKIGGAENAFSVGAWLILNDRFRAHRDCVERVLIRAAERGERIGSNLASVIGRGA